MTLDQIAASIALQTGQAVQPAAATDLATLAAAGYPAAVVTWYALYQPTGCAEVGGVRLWPVAQLMEENQAYVPGSSLFPLGYPVIATSEFGDAFCLDLAEPGGASTAPVVLFSHELPYGEMPPEDIRRLAKPVAASFADFLIQFVEARLDREPRYRPV